MISELTVLLIEDDIEDCNEIENYISLVDDVDLVGITNNTSDALEMVQKEIFYNKNQQNLMCS